MNINVKFNTTKDVGDFVNSALTAPFDITAGEGRYIVDGKSVLGILSLDLSNPVKIEWEEFNDETAETAFMEKIKKFIVT
ncbi:MAG TPA: HPr family phosphocarrier protein [bacterium]|nr:HPr family phosphocarrier protein [bacterium]